MGITDEFGSSDDFTRMASKENALLYISRVIQKTYIEVDEKGTKAAAVTAVMSNGAAPIQEYKTVYLDRPCVYMLIDCRSNVPFFSGTLMDVPKH
jgi:serpin B